MKILQNQGIDIRINIKIPFRLEKFKFEIVFKEIVPFSGGQILAKIMQIAPLSKIKEDIYEKK